MKVEAVRFKPGRELESPYLFKVWTLFFWGVGIIKAAVLENIGKISITERPQPKCQPGDVLLAVEVAGLCRTDMKAYTVGQRDLRLPRVLGHEITATVVEACEATGFRYGDRVQVAPGVCCGNCRFCRQGYDHLCDRVEIMGFHRDGGFQEYLLIPAAAVKNGLLNYIPDSLSFEEACMTEPLACAINMQDRLQIDGGDVVLLWGGGPLGVLNARLARSRGVKEVIIVEPHLERMGYLEGLENTCRLATGVKDLAGILKAVTEQGTADVVIPCCPDPEAFRGSLQLCSKRGRIGFFSGLTPRPDLVNSDLNLIHYLELTLVGAYGCSVKHSQMALQLINSGDVVVRDMVTRRIALEELQRGLDLIALGKEMKIVLYMRKGR